MILSVIGACILHTHSTDGLVSSMDIGSRGGLRCYLRRILNTLLSTWVTDSWAAHTSMNGRTLSATLRSSQRWLGTVSTLLILVLFACYTLVVLASTYPSLGRIMLVILVLRCIVRLEHIWCTRSLLLCHSICRRLVLGFIRITWSAQNNWRILFEDLLEAKSISSESLLVFYFCVIKFHQALQLSDDIGSIVGMFRAWIRRKPKHLKVGKVGQMSNLLQIWDLILPYIQLLDVLTVDKVAQSCNVVVRQRDCLQTLHFSNDWDVVNVIAPHIDVL